MITYVLIDPRDAKIKYVGITSKTIEARLKQHIATAIDLTVDWGCRTGRVTRSSWMGELKKEGLAPIIAPIFSFNNEGDAIRSLIASGAKLTNNMIPRATNYGVPVPELYKEIES